MTDRASPTVLVLGLGNSILTDDRVGLELARAIVTRLAPGAVELGEASVGGMELLHVLEGWERVLLVDAWNDPREPDRLAPGELAEIPLGDLAPAAGALSPHTAGLGECLAMGRACGLAMPSEVRIFVVGVEDALTFGERCTPAVEAAIPSLADRIVREVFGPGGWA